MENAVEPKRLEVDEDGAVHVSAFRLPLSAALSDHARRRQAVALGAPRTMTTPRARDFTSEADFRSAVDSFRAAMDKGFARPLAERLLQTFPVRISPSRIADVPVEEFTPLDGQDGERVLINLHGGAFCAGATHIGRVESIPMAHLGRFRVVSVDYRQGYEHKFPAASEDVAAVYAEFLKDYPARRIGLYGGSAGGALTAQATAWILQQGLPAPGAIGVFGAGTGGCDDGDYFSAIGTGSQPPAVEFGALADGNVGYFSDASDEDPLVNPNIAPEAFRARFPPTLLITGTRAYDLSPAIATHRALASAGVEASLHVFDGQGHCFYYDAASPEGVDAYQTIIRFFRKHLV